MNLKNEIEIDEGVEIKNDQWFRQLMPRYLGYTKVDYTEAWFLNGDKYRGGSVFDFANNHACSCAYGYTDSKFDTHDFKRNMTMQNILQGQSSPCTDEMRDFECYFRLRQYDAFDLSVENVAKDGCTACYGIGQDLWPLTEDELIDTLTRSMGDNEDCTPKQGYHKSNKRNEIYRCEEGDNLNGIIAFTEANGETDYECGFYLYADSNGHRYINPDITTFVNTPIILVSVFDYVQTLLKLVRIVILSMTVMLMT